MGTRTRSLLLQRATECRRLLDAQPHIQAHQHQHRAGEERHAPAPCQELRVAQHVAQQQEHARRAQMKPIGAPSCGNMPYQFCLPGGAFSVASSTAPPHSPTEPEALAEAAQRQQRRREQARGLRRSAAGRWRRSTCPSSAAPPPAWPCARCDRRSVRTPPSPRAARRTPARRWPATAASRRAGSRGGKEQLRKHQHGGGGVDVEIEELDRGADQAGEQHRRGEFAEFPCTRLHLFFDERALDDVVAGLADARRDHEAALVEQAARVLRACRDCRRA